MLTTAYNTDKITQWLVKSKVKVKILKGHRCDLILDIVDQKKRKLHSQISCPMLQMMFMNITFIS